MIWFKWRQNSSASYGKWEYVCWCGQLTIEQFKEYLQSTGQLDTWSEHYRGVDVEIVDPPREVIQKELQNAELALVSAQNKCAALRAILKV